MTCHPPGGWTPMRRQPNGDAFHHSGLALAKPESLTTIAIRPIPTLLFHACWGFWTGGVSSRGRSGVESCLVKCRDAVGTLQFSKYQQENTYWGHEAI